jgi:integrase
VESEFTQAEEKANETREEIMQRGRIFQKGSSWILQYRDVDGTQRCRKLADVDERFATKRAVENANLAAKFLNPVNAVTASKNGMETIQTVANFVEFNYLVNVQKRPSTVYGYKHIFNKHLKTRLGTIRLIDFTTGVGQRLMRRIATEEPHLSGLTLKHIKNFLTGVFTYAKQEGFFNGENPMWEVEVPGGNSSRESNKHAYALTEIAAILDALDGVEPARTVIATAAFTGLRKSELRGLRWGDLDDGKLRVNRTVWGSVVEEKTKTEASKAPVPILPMLADLLEEHRNGLPQDGFIFAGPKLNRPLDLHNLVARIIRPS